MHRPYRDLQNLKFSCLYLFPSSHKVVPQKASGGVVITSFQLLTMSVGGGWGWGVVYHTSLVYWSTYRGGNFFFFFFFESGLKLNEKSIENGVEGQKFLVVCLFSGVVATTPNNYLMTYLPNFVHSGFIPYVKLRSCSQVTVSDPCCTVPPKHRTCSSSPS